MLPDLDSFEHPWLLLIMALGLGLMVLAVLSALLGYSALGGFFAVYSVVTILIASFGYVGMYSMKMLARV